MVGFCITEREGLGKSTLISVGVFWGFLISNRIRNAIERERDVRASRLKIKSMWLH